MSKFNKKEHIKRTTNLAGGSAFSESAKLELISLVLTSFVQDKFYESEASQLTRLRKLIDKINDKKFVAQLAIYARNVFGMRSISHVLAGEIGVSVKGEQWTKNFFDKVIRRPDDITEILAYSMKEYGRVIPNAMKKGLASALTRFDDYALGKYRCESHAIKMVDAVNLLHPKETPTIKKLMDGTLKSTDTWEVEISQAGQTEDKENVAALKKEAWSGLVTTGKIGYFALLRNLRNILEQSPECIDEALKILTDEDRIKKSLVLPFRYQTAKQAIIDSEVASRKDSVKVLSAISDAIDISCQNVPKFEGNTLVALDMSGSMSGKPWDIGSLFAAVIAKKNESPVLTFSDQTHWVTFSSRSSVIDIVEALGAKRNYGGTDFSLIFHQLKEKFDRIIILSDMQGWLDGGAPTQALKAYKTRTGANPKIFSFDLNGYGSLMFPEPNVYCLTGFSEKTLDLMKILEEDRAALTHAIENIEL